MNPKHVLFLCTGNSARSLIAESLLRRLGTPRFVAYSAGSHPTGQPHPLALRLLREKGHDVSQLRSKSWDEFALPDAPALDIVITVCGNARAETCPIWPGQPTRAHWGSDDPAAAIGDEAKRIAAFERVHNEIEARVRALLEIASDAIDPTPLGARLAAIGRTAPA